MSQDGEAVRVQPELLLGIASDIANRYWIPVRKGQVCRLGMRGRWCGAEGGAEVEIWFVLSGGGLGRDRRGVTDVAECGTGIWGRHI